MFDESCCTNDASIKPDNILANSTRTFGPTGVNYTMKFDPLLCSPVFSPTDVFGPTFLRSFVFRRCIYRRYLYIFFTFGRLVRFNYGEEVNILNGVIRGKEDLFSDDSNKACAANYRLFWPPVGPRWIWGGSNFPSSWARWISGVCFIAERESNRPARWLVHSVDIATGCFRSSHERRVSNCTINAYLFSYLLISSSLFFCNINVNNNIILIVIVISAKEVRLCLCLFVYANRITRYVLYQIRCGCCTSGWETCFQGVNLASHS